MPLLIVCKKTPLFHPPLFTFFIIFDFEHILYKHARNKRASQLQRKGDFMASADLKKLHGGAASHTRNHIYRHDGKDVEYKNEHIDKSKTHLNTEMRFPEHEGIVLSDDEDRFLRARVSEIDKKEPPIRVRKDRVTFVAFEAPVPDGTDTKEKEEAFFKIFYEEVARMCGGPQNVGVLKIHRDEIHPYIDPVTLDEKMSRVHAHCIGIPYVRGKGINCKMFMSKGNLRSLQNALDTRCREELGVSYLSRDEHAVLRGRRVEDIKIASAKASRDLAEKIITQESRLAELDASIEIARNDAQKYREEAQQAKQERDDAEKAIQRAQQELITVQMKLEEIHRLLSEAENMSFDDRVSLLRFRDRMLALQKRYPEHWEAMRRSEEKRKSRKHEKNRQRDK